MVKAPLGSGKSYQARRLQYSRICSLTSTRSLAVKTCRITGYANYQDIPHSTPLSWVDKVVVLAPSLYRMKHDFEKFHCLIIEECESVLHDIFRRPCRGAKFELILEVFTLLMNTTPKILFMDGFLKNSSLSVATNFAPSLKDIRLLIATYTIDRGTL